MSQKRKLKNREAKFLKSFGVEIAAKFTLKKRSGGIGMCEPGTSPVQIDKL